MYRVYQNTRRHVSMNSALSLSVVRSLSTKQENMTIRPKFLGFLMRQCGIVGNRIICETIVVLRPKCEALCVIIMKRSRVNVKVSSL